MRLILVFALLLYSGQACSQQYQTHHGSVSFFAEAPIENIAATNKNAFAFVDLSTGEITGQLTIANFEFKKPLMKTHFNEKYMESKRFPVADFRGKITDYKPMGGLTQQLMVKGKLTIHGQTREVKIPVVIHTTGDQITFSTAFVVMLADYGIQAPRMFWRNITDDVTVKADLVFMLPDSMR